LTVHQFEFLSDPDSYREKRSEIQSALKISQGEYIN